MNRWPAHGATELQLLPVHAPVSASADCSLNWQSRTFKGSGAGGRGTLRCHCQRRKQHSRRRQVLRPAHSEVHGSVSLYKCPGLTRACTQQNVQCLCGAASRGPTDTTGRASACGWPQAGKRRWAVQVRGGLLRMSGTTGGAKAEQAGCNLRGLCLVYERKTVPAAPPARLLAGGATAQQSAKKKEWLNAGSGQQKLSARAPGCRPSLVVAPNPIKLQLPLPAATDGGMHVHAMYAATRMFIGPRRTL
jgi:hypothetical protein